MTAPENPTSNVEQAVGEVLAAHKTWSTFPSGFMRFDIVCGCGERFRDITLDDHDAHVAEQVAAVVAGREEKAWDEGWNAAVDSDGYPGDVNPYRERADRETP